jgi:tetratricopeptide (TPR) repeat protein
MKLALIEILVLSFAPQVADASYREYDCAAVDREYSSENVQLFEDDRKAIAARFAKWILDAMVAERSSERRAELYYCLAEHDHENGDLPSAEHFYTKSIQESGNNPWPYVSRGLLYREWREYDKALKDFATATGLDGSIGAAYFYKAEANYLLKNYDDAIQDLQEERALRNGAPSLSSSILKGDIYFELKDYERAIESYQEGLQVLNELAPWEEGKAPRTFPKEISVYGKLITTFCVSGQSDLAKGRYEVLLRRNQQGTELSSLSCW